MIQLAIETSGSVGSLAVLSDQTPLQSFPLPRDQRTAATLAVRLQEAIRWCRAEGRTIDFMSVAKGPGSFTGLRIGLTTAKAYCYATGLPLVAIDSIAAVAASRFSEDPAIESVLVAVNAYRGQVFSGTYQRKTLLPTSGLATAPTRDAPGERESIWRTAMESARVLDRCRLDDLAASAPPSTYYAGDESLFGGSAGCALGMKRYLRSQRTEAHGVGILGHHAAAWQQWVDPIQLTPRYLKSSAAEEQASP